MTDIEVAIRFFDGWKNRDEKDRKILPQNTIAYNAYTKEIEYLELAIKALKQMETLEQESCEDAVSRKTVKEQMIYYGFHAPDMTVTEFVDDCLPSVNPQKPKMGHWKERRNRATGHIETVCSECGAEEGYPYNDYCGNCGAQMFEPQESEEKE